ncbi:glucan 1,4-alpha-glucosidase [Aureibaculum marinum]|uniref:Glucan 1,4-alpha-glucosidase n=1 Tax=Aureibaculum marinum TaxID=2487930 RepID=A0A3N4P125_9FLAO|nr:glycoside hydrolase family 3 C-terminal domain-containing protein [Aureibaculum marinum]RPD98706.1 glucan 1,4-alpha-glucosidase [Aureibaculum marinum]
MKKSIVFLLMFMPLFVVSQNVKYPFQDSALDAEVRADDFIQRLSLSEKIAQMQDVAPAIERLGIPKYNWWNECLHGVARAGSATSFPQAIGMAATFNVPLINKVASVISTEARAKYNHSIKLGQHNRYQGLTMWTPNINIFRDPRWGRGQETYGEDPYLTSKMGVAFIKGLQGDNPNYFKVIATPKHFAVHSGPEHNRHSFNAYTDKKDLWETYLPAFEAAIVEGKAFSVMSAYNRYLGASATASKLLLNDILREKWGFEGYVVSDCGAVYDIYKFHEIVETAEEASALAVKAGCDLNCGNTYAHLDKAVEKGLITEKEIDIALKRLIIAKIKLGLLNVDGKTPFSDISNDSLESEAHQKLALKTARESMVLLKNENNILPLSNSIKSIAVIGPNANDRHFVLGNYFGTPTYSKTILEGIKEQVSKKTKVHYFKGVNIADDKPVFDVVGNKNYHGKIKVEYYNNSNLEGDPSVIKTLNYIDFDWGGAAPVDVLEPGNFSIRYSGIIKPDFTGEVALNVLISGGTFKLMVDGKQILESSNNQEEVEPKAMFLEKNKKYNFVLEYKCTNPWLASLQLLWDIEHRMGKERMIEKVKESDVVVYVGGISARLEGEEMPVNVEGFYKGDRTNLKLPKVQHELLKELNSLGKPIVFVLTGGSAMAINWEQENLDAILNVWYPGQGGGEATADILFGNYNPSGKLPVTFYKSVEDLPPFEDYHMKGRTYRYFNGDVLYPFGYGLSFTDFTYSKPVLDKKEMGKDDSNKVSVIVTNTGDFDGETVVQFYINDKEASVATPQKSLKGFQKIFLKKGASQKVEFDITSDVLSIFDTNGNTFIESGIFEVFVGENSATTNKETFIVK